jgi:hypothetical protein
MRYEVQVTIRAETHGDWVLGCVVANMLMDQPDKYAVTQHFYKGQVFRARRTPTGIIVTQRRS